MNPYTLETIESWERMPREHIKINKEKLKEDALRRAFEKMGVLVCNHPGTHPKNRWAFPSHNFWWNVVNFAFTHFGGRRRDGSLIKYRNRTVLGEDVSGALAMMACFYRAFWEKPIFAKDMLPHLASLKKTKKFFRGYNSIPMIGERRNLLLEVCAVLEERFDGDPWYIWEEGCFRAYGDGRRLGIVELLKIYFPSAFGSDCWQRPTVIWPMDPGLTPNEKPLIFHFDKRAHLCVLLYHNWAENDGVLPMIKDINELGAIPDYELPRSYEASGIFEYSDELNEMIAAGRLIEPGSQMELEIRGATCSAQIEELSVINQERKKHGLSPRHIGHADCYRWQSGRKAKTNHHLCKTNAY